MAVFHLEGVHTGKCKCLKTTVCKGEHFKCNEASANARETMFDCLCDCMPSTSACVCIRSARPGRFAQAPADTGITHYDWLYVGKYTDAVCVYFARESKYSNISVKELVTFEVGFVEFQEY